MSDKKTTTKKADVKKTEAKKTETKKADIKKTEAKKSVKVQGEKYVLEINKMQYLASPGEVIEIRVSPDATDKDLEVNVLAVISSDDKIEYGKPHLDKKADFTVLETVLGKKVTSTTFKAKARQRRKVGFRPKFKQFKLNKVS